jgi:hypothetical protein
MPTHMDQTAHAGWMSTDMIYKWTNKFNGFSEITIILKSLLKLKGLNEASKGNNIALNFLGGISSYCLAVMLKAII